MSNAVEFLGIQGPYLQLGFYWSGRTEQDGYRSVFRWLTAHGYEMHPSVFAARAVDGDLPRFQCAESISTSALDIEVEEFSEWTPDQVLNDSEWCPLIVKFRPTNEMTSPIELELCYALMHEESFKAGEPHVVELIVSYADLNLLENCDAKDLPRGVVKKARQTRKWVDTTFRSICDDLCPDYAGVLVENSVEPPKSLIAKLDEYGLIKLYLSSRVMLASEGPSELAVINGFDVTQFNKGACLEFRLPLDWDRIRKGLDEVRSIVATARKGGAFRLRDTK